MVDGTKKKGEMSHSWWIAVIFLLLSLTFVFDYRGHPRRIIENPIVDPKYFSNVHVRNPFHAPQMKRSSFVYNCNSCHKGIEPPQFQRKLIAAHQNIIMEHGVVSRCYTCHNSKKRELLVDIFGEDIPFSKSELICQKCHGPKFRDWKIGVHGRQSGYWDKSRLESKKVTCVDCHNPHSPKFKPMKPLPGPIRNNTSTERQDIHE